MATPNLSYYISQTQLLLHDSRGTLYPTADLTAYINSARSQMALETQCVRFNYGYDGIALSGVFTSGSVTVTGVTVPTLDVITNWVLQAPAVVTPGTTVVTTGVGTITLSAAATATGTFPFTVGPPNNTSNLVESYALPSVVCVTNGVAAVIGVESLTLNWGGASGSNAYMLDNWSWREFQAYLRFYGPVGLQGQPAVWTRYQNNLMLRPVPSQVYPMQWDAICSVFDLTSDSSPEAIPYPFTDAVPYYAAYLALLNGQRSADAQQMKERYEEYIKRARAFWQRTVIPTMYPGSGYR